MRMSSKTSLQDPIFVPPPLMHTMVETMHEDSATGYTRHFPEYLPARPRPAEAPSGWRGRLRSRFWTFSLSSYDIVHTHDGQIRIRHITMVAILLLRAAMSGLSILSAIVKKNVAAIIIYILLALLSVWFNATCLAIIGDAAGDRRVTGVIIVSPWASLCRTDARADFEFRNAGTSMLFSDSVPSSTPYLLFFSSSVQVDWAYS